MSTRTAERTDQRTAPDETDGRDGPVAHVVEDPEGRGRASAWVTEARVLGTELTAVCGARFVPSRDPERLPVCGACREALSRG